MAWAGAADGHLAASPMPFSWPWADVQILRSYETASAMREK